MSLHTEKLRAVSPASSADGSGRKSLGGRDGQDEQLKKSKPYRRYAAGVERALGLFDTALQEWADYIAFLSRLQKALQAQPEGIRVIPDKRLVAKRLAQCLNPSLPSGVHQKTLEVYALVFALQGREGLSQDLAQYLPGISSTLTFASLTVRPIFLSIVEDHILRLPVNTLRPALKAIILSLLPGIEEETSEDFDRVLGVLNRLKDSFTAGGSGGIFWQCLFLASITSPSRRLGVLAYLTRYLPRLGPAMNKFTNGSTEGTEEAITAVTDPEPGLLIRCFATGLLDKQILVQRMFLDLLVTHLPLNASFYKEKVVREDFQVLVNAAASVVLRRDMSLNRRLWSWFLGPENRGDPNGSSVPTSPEESNKQIGQPSEASDVPSGPKYFITHGLDILVASLQSTITRKPLASTERAQPLRIALSLMDRWEIGGPVVAAIFLPLMKSVQEYESIAPSPEAFDEVLRSANVFFDGVESSLIWAQMLQVLDNPGSGESQAEQYVQDLHLAKYIITKFNIQEEEMVSIHIPLVLLALLCIQQVLKDQKRPVYGEIVELAQSLAVLVADRALVAPVARGSLACSSPLSALERIRTFYAGIQSNLSLPQLPFKPAELGEMLLRWSVSLLTSYLIARNDNHLESMTQVLITIISKMPSSIAFTEVLQGLLERFDLAISQLPGAVGPAVQNLAVGWRTVSCATSTLVAVCSLLPEVASQSYLFSLVPLLVTHLWNLLEPNTPQYHIEAVRHIWGLQTVSSKYRLVESNVTAIMVSASSANGGTDTTPGSHPSHRNQHRWPVPTSTFGRHSAGIERFAALWNHSVTMGLLSSGNPSMLDGPLLLVLDFLANQHSDFFALCKDWLQGTSVPSLTRIFETIILPLMQNHEADILEANASLQRLSDVISAQSHQQWSWFVLEPLAGVLADHAPAPGRNTLQAIVARLCEQLSDRPELQTANSVARKAFGLLCQILQGPSGDLLVDEQLEDFLILKLDHSISTGDTKLQTDLIDAMLVLQNLKLNRLKFPTANKATKLQHRRLTSREKNSSNLQLAIETEPVTRGTPEHFRFEPSPRLMPCLHRGITSTQARPIIDKWMILLCEVLPLYTGSIFQILISVVETLCKEITVTFRRMRSLFSSQSQVIPENPEKSLNNLVSGLEYILAQAHERLNADETQLVTAKTPDQPQGFLGNMVSGTSTTEGNQIRNNMANNRLTVVLCLQDSVRVLVDLWSWEKQGATSSSDRFASFQHTSSKLRNRSRRILEHLIEAEPLEALETLIELWVRAAKSDSTSTTTSVLDLLQTLNASRPRYTIPAIFNAIYSRTNATVLNKNQRSTLSSNLSEIQLVSFLVHYASSLEDDILDEIWTDCTTFLRDVLGNPMPHRRILPRLLEFIAVIGQKMENTNFGEESRMRRELGDLFVRLLTAIFTIKPGNQGQDSITQAEIQTGFSQTQSRKQYLLGSDNVVDILCNTLPSMNHILGESDRLVGVVTSVSSQIVGPAIRSKNFPNTVSPPMLSLMQKEAKMSNAAKTWKKDIRDAFDDSRFFQTPYTLIKEGWLPLIGQWYLTDRTLGPELLSRLTIPTAAGLMFGVGASAARLEADKRTQLNIRRMATLTLAADNDALSVDSLRTKVEETLTASRVSSPSSLTRAEIFMLVRALTLKCSPAQLAPLWPLLSAELHDLFSTIVDGHSDAYNGFSILQAAKLLDLLLVVEPDDFQLHEWLFVTDTLDAIYPPDNWHTAALIDEVAEVRHPQTPVTPHPSNTTSDHSDGLRRPWLCGEVTRSINQDEVVDKVLWPFFGQLSIHAFESTYSLGNVDREACIDDLLADLFNDDTIAS